MTEGCSECRFWKGTTDRYSGFGPCRRYPPGNQEHPRGGPATKFPMTGSYDWCGEFSRAPSPA